VQPRQVGLDAAAQVVVPGVRVHPDEVRDDTAVVRARQAQQQPSDEPALGDPDGTVDRAG
jgi:hypothetical protein